MLMGVQMDGKKGIKYLCTYQDCVPVCLCVMSTWLIRNEVVGLLKERKLTWGRPNVVAITSRSKMRGRGLMPFAFTDLNNTSS